MSASSSSFTLKIILDNDAFHPDPRPELITCLNNVADQLLQGSDLAFIRDSNGNRVGSYVLVHTPKEPNT